MNTEFECESIPFILFFSSPRRTAEAIPGTYDENINVMVIDTAGQKIPLIKVTSMPENITVTKVSQESNDEQYNSIMLETITRTAHQREHPDASNDYLLESLTKSRANRESEDDSFTLKELYTKTEVQREQEDNDFGY